MCQFIEEAQDNSESRPEPGDEYIVKIPANASTIREKAPKIKEMVKNGYASDRRTEGL